MAPEYLDSSLRHAIMAVKNTRGSNNTVITLLSNQTTPNQTCQQKQVSADRANKKRK
jgi:hypothetical protein